MSSTISGIILASGASKRMGCNKLALKIHDKPMLQHVIDAALASCLCEVVVIFPDTGFESSSQQASYIAGLCLEGCKVLYNPLHGLGQSESLKVGIQHMVMHASPSLTGAMVLLGDQPFVTPTIIDTLVERAGAAPTSWVIPQRASDGQKGNPVIIPSVEFARVLELYGDTGARPLLHTTLFEKCYVTMDDDAPFVDIDTPEMYAKYAREE